MTTKTTRGPKRSREQIEADLNAQLARIQAKKHIDNWASDAAENITNDAKATLGVNSNNGLRALARLLAAQTKED